MVNIFINSTAAQSKWGVSHERWPWTTYPGYLSGGCILISGRAVGLLLAAAQVTPYFDIDDVYTSGIIASKAGITIWKNWWYDIIALNILLRTDTYNLN